MCVCVCVSLQVELPFKVSPVEWDIIIRAKEPPRSIILLGRSGTGKTTCAVYRYAPCTDCLHVRLALCTSSVAALGRLAWVCCDG